MGEQRPPIEISRTWLVPHPRISFANCPRDPLLLPDGRREIGPATRH